MSTTERVQPVLSPEEWKLVAELLEAERGDLPAEIHRTRTSSVRDQLRERLETIKDLIERIRECTN